MINPIIMALWTNILRYGSITTNSHFVFATKKALHQCVKQRTLSVSNLVHFPKKCTFLSVTSFTNCSSHQNYRSVTSATHFNATTGLLQSDSKDNSDDDQAPVEWSGESEDITLKLSEEEIQQLSGGDPEIIKKISFIQLEHEICRQHGILVPMSPINVSRWEELLSCQSQTKRKKYYSFLFKLEKSKENEIIKKQLKKQERAELLAKTPQLPPLGEDPDGVIYGLHRNTLFVRLYDTSQNHFYHGRLLQEIMFGQPFILDCGFGEYMTTQEAKNCAKQLESGFVENREHPQPFNLHFCNAYPDDHMIKWFHKRAPYFSKPEALINITSKSYLDMFPREKLVYLSPHTSEELLEFSHDDIYIMGCIVDKGDQRPLSAAKAKRENIRMKKLPLDRYLDWGLGSKCLTLNQVLNIMLDLRHCGDWKKSFSHIPTRKLKGGRGECSDFTDSSF